MRDAGERRCERHMGGGIGIGSAGSSATAIRRRAIAEAARFQRAIIRHSGAANWSCAAWHCRGSSTADANRAGNRPCGSSAPSKSRASLRRFPRLMKIAASLTLVPPRAHMRPARLVRVPDFETNRQVRRPAPPVRGQLGSAKSTRASDGSSSSATARAQKPLVPAVARTIAH